MPKTVAPKTRPFTIGREQFQKISAVEGVHLNRGMHEEFREFDRQEMPAAERRRILVAKYGRKS
jgi:hypothetical protein